MYMVITEIINYVYQFLCIVQHIKNKNTMASLQILTKIRLTDRDRQPKPHLILQKQAAELIKLRVEVREFPYH